MADLCQHFVIKACAETLPFRGSLMPKRFLFPQSWLWESSCLKSVLLAPAGGGCGGEGPKWPYECCYSMSQVWNVTAHAFCIFLHFLLLAHSFSCQWGAQWRTTAPTGGGKSFFLTLVFYVLIVFGLGPRESRWRSFQGQATTIWSDVLWRTRVD